MVWMFPRDSPLAKNQEIAERWKVDDGYILLGRLGICQVPLLDLRTVSADSACVTLCLKSSKPIISAVRRDVFVDSCRNVSTHTLLQ